MKSVTQRLNVRPCCLSRSRSLDMAVTGDSGKKKRGGKVFGSLERGLDKMITMLTPNKRRALRSGPRKIKVYRSDAPCFLFPTQHDILYTASLLLCFCLLGTVQRYSDQPYQPRPGPEPDPVHPAREKC